MTRFRVDDSFRPSWWLRGPHLQSILPSLLLRRAAIERRAIAMREAARELILDCGDGVRLQCFHSSPARRGKSVGRSLVVLLHGWEGSADSLYVLSIAQQLFDAGFEVVRLNLRDHGNTHHLNRDLFHSCRLPEVVGAVRAIQRQFPEQQLMLAGFSLGGNFMLRVAAAAPSEGIKVTRVVAVSPVLDPARTLRALEQGLSLYEKYFILKWRRSLLKKQAAWPDDYDFEHRVRGKSLAVMTEELVVRHTHYPALQTYLADYAITGERLAALQMPCCIITARDDPMIPPADLDLLADSPQLEVILTERGGHCGFVERLREPSWADRKMLAAFQQQ